jgi:pyruvate/2-oxoglutarate/acetoin dehydrogenase E1 component
MTAVRMREAIAQALADEMEADPNVILLGEDIAAAGGAFKATEGLLQRFGPTRVRDTPISEMGFLGAAVGAAVTGLRPVVEMMFVEFTGVALDQLVTEAAKLRYLSRGSLSCPLTLRASVGAGLGFGCQHSQFLDNWFRATPGLKVVVPSGAGTAYGLLRAAIRDPDPVVVLEPRVLYAEREDVEFGQAGVMRIGQSSRLSDGEDVTIVALGPTVRTAMAAINEAAGAWTAEVIDLRSLVPWDHVTITDSVRRTRRLVIVEESPYSGGWGSDICYHVCGDLSEQLKAPPLRITTPDAPVPYSGRLEQRFLPSPEYVVTQVTALLRTGRRPDPWWEQPEYSK